MPNDLAAAPYLIVDDAVLCAGLAGFSPSDPVHSHPKRDRLPLKRIGVRLADGTTTPLAATTYRNRRHHPAALDPAGPDLPILPGLSVFAGVAGPQFGHLITESLGRLWLAQKFPEARIVFLAASLGFDRLPGYFEGLLRHLGLHNPVHVLTETSRCEQLVLGRDLCNLTQRPSVAPAYLQWLRRQCPLPATALTLNLYVSRSGLSLGHGQYLQETELEEALARQGYVIIRPELLDIPEQVRLYRQARRVILADGSAAHLWSLFAHPDTKAAIVLRRPRDRRFVGWFKGLDGPRPLFLDHCIASLSRRGEGGGRSVGLIDLRAVWSELRRAGFHSDRTQIGTPRAELDAWVSQIAGRQGRIPAPPFALDSRSQALVALRSRVAAKP